MVFCAKMAEKMRWHAFCSKNCSNFEDTDTRQAGASHLEITFAKSSELQLNQQKTTIYASIMHFFVNLFGISIFLL